MSIDPQTYRRDMWMAWRLLVKCGVRLAALDALTWIASKSPLRPTPPKTWEEFERDIYVNPFTGNYADAHPEDALGEAPRAPRRFLMPMLRRR